MIAEFQNIIKNIVLETTEIPEDFIYLTAIGDNEYNTPPWASILPDIAFLTPAWHWDNACDTGGTKECGSLPSESSAQETSNPLRDRVFLKVQRKWDVVQPMLIHLRTVERETVSLYMAKILELLPWRIPVSGAMKCEASVSITVITAGAAGSAEINISITGDKTGSEILLIPANGTIALEDLGITLLFPTEGDFALTDAWSFGITAPTSTFAALQAALDAALELHNPEFVFVCQTTTAADAVNWSAAMETLFTDKHQPLFALLETNLDSSKPLAEAVTAKVKEFQGIDARFVSVVCQPLANWQSAAALCAGTLTRASVNQSIGATKYFGMWGLQLPEGWTNQTSRSLDEARFITLRTYAGLNGLFWANGRTLASDTSDYRFIEVVRTVFKAVRLARRASLPYIQAPGDESGLQALLATVRAALTKMTASNPKELDDFAVDMPSGQDVVNNGVQLDISLYGIPIIRKIILNFMFKYNQEV